MATDFSADSKKRWTTDEVNHLLELIKTMKLEEVSKVLGRTHSSVEHKCQRLKLKLEAHIIYTEEFKNEMYEFYMQSTQKETCAKFGLSQKTLEALINRIRKKENKTYSLKKNNWTSSEMLFTLKYIGLQPKSFIANHLSRTEDSISSFIKRVGFRLHYVNGLKKDEIDKNFKVNPMLFIRNIDGDFIMPWVIMEDNLKIINADDNQKSVIIAMARFQRFLHCTKNNRDTIESITNILQYT